MEHSKMLAHIAPDGREQTVQEHLEGTARRSGAFAKAFGAEDWGYLLGYAHDIGKCSVEFQKRLLGGAKVDHATAGALKCAQEINALAGCCIAGHHGGLPDYGNPGADQDDAPTFIGRMKRGMAGKFPVCRWEGQLPKPGPMPPFRDHFALSVWVRMLYSCLVDGDYLDTEAFMASGPVERGGYDPLSVLLERLEKFTDGWFPPKNELNERRCRILRQCLDAGAGQRGVYTLTVPTGGGKTVSSLAFALKHAVENGLERVIYVVPYTSIIEQNAEVFRNILGRNNVVEHHSGVEWDDEEETNTANRLLRLASENWDAPVIVTTAVQFFESLYANRPSQCRKLHNIANSVLIFDEAQMLPADHLTPCVGVMAEMAAHFRSTVVLCTATQPVLEDLLHGFCPELTVRELCPETAGNFAQFRRVTFRDGGVMTDQELALELADHQQALCIVNTRKSAQALYDLLPERGRFHLSTLMYPAHRKAVLETIRHRLKEGLPCRVVSTSLIEAGVDVDFPAVYRELAGLDAIAQAAGRCNREGKRTAEESVVTYFEGERRVPVLQRIGVQATREALHGGGDPGSPETMERYFRAWRSLIGSYTDKTRAVYHLREDRQGCLLPFVSVAKDFHLIDQAACTVYIPEGAGTDLCKKLLEGTAGKRDYRAAGQYSVSVYPQHFRALMEAGDILALSENSAVLTNEGLYDLQMGLSLQADPGRAEFI